MAADIPYDVIVIGSGVCGAIAAWQLAEGDQRRPSDNPQWRVLLLEAGERGPERVDLVAAYARAVVKTPGSPYRGGDGDFKAPGPESDPHYYQHAYSESSRRFKSTYLRRVGGSTWHFLGNVPRFVPADFRLKSNYGVGVDWPLEYADLEADYGLAERHLGVAGDDGEWADVLGAYRSIPFPMQPIWESYADRVVRRRMGDLSVDGTPIIIRRTPQARNSEPYDGRPPCAGNSTCVPICPIQAKYDATVHVAKAEQAGVKLLTGAVVTRLSIESGGTRVSKVHYLDWAGEEQECTGRVVVLAAHAIESAKILLCSDPGSHRIANSSGQVGRNLMDHPQGAGGCLMPEPVFPFRGPPTTSGIDDFRDGEFRRTHAAFRMSLGNDGWGNRIESPVRTIVNLIEKKKLIGASLKAEVRHTLTRQFRISYSTEMLPDDNNQVTLSDQLDALGIPKPKLRFQLDGYNLRAFGKARDTITRIFERMGAQRDTVQFSPPLDKDLFTGAGHILGTCRMGEDRRQGVVDRDCRSFDHPNLFILGSSVFPTAGTANPTLTAVALTFRAVRQIERQLSAGP